MSSGAFSCARGRGCYVEIVSGDPFEVDFVDLGVIFGPVAFPAALALFFREKAWSHYGLATVSLSGAPGAQKGPGLPMAPLGPYGALWAHCVRCGAARSAIYTSCEGRLTEVFCNRIVPANL